MKNLRYLKDGSEVQLIETLAKDRYLIQRWIETIITDNEGYEIDRDQELHETIELYEGSLLSVKPKMKFDEQIANQKAEISELEKQILEAKNEFQDYKIKIQEANRELHDIKEKKTDIQKGFLNITQLKNAKSIHYFEYNKVVPVSLEEKSLKQYQDQNIFLEQVVYYNNDKKKIESRIKFYNYSSFGTKIDRIYIDKSENEMIEISKSIQREWNKDQIKRQLNHIINSNDKWLIPELIEVKKSGKIEDLQNKIKTKKSNIEKMELETASLSMELDKIQMKE